MSKYVPVDPARLQFTWSCSPDAPARWVLGTFCFFRRAKSPRTGKYYVPVKSTKVYPLAVIVSVRGFLLWSLALALVAYFAGAALIVNWLDRRSVNLVTYSDLVMPWRWSGLKTLRGQSNLAQAEVDLKSGNIRSALAYLRSGLARFPDDAKARLQLASVYVLVRIRPEAEKSLIGAFDHAYPGGDYLKKAVSLLEAGDNPEFLMRFCDRGRAALVAGGPDSGRDARFLDGVKVKTLLDLDRVDEAVALIEKYQPDDFVFLQNAKVAQGLVRGDLAAAEAALDVWRAAMPDGESALSAAVRVYRAAGKVPEMQAAILRLRSLYPTEAKHIGLALSETLLAGRVQDALDLLDISVIRFANQSSAYGEWADAIGKTGHDDVLARLEQLVREMNQNPQAVIFTRMMAQIRQRDWVAAEASSERLDTLYPQVHERIQALHRVAKALLAACSDPAKGAQNTLAETITGGWVGMALYEQIVDALATSERYEAALEVLTLAEGYFPTSRYIAAQRTVIAEKLQEQNAELARTSSENAPAAIAVPADAKALFAALDALLDAGRPSAPEALRLIRAVRKASPAWLRPELAELEWRDVLFASEADDLALLQLNLRNSLRGASAARIERTLGQAKAWFAAQRQPHALLAVREVLRVRPKEPGAVRLLAEWSPPPGVGDGAPAVSAAPAALPSPGAASTAPAVPASAESFFKTLDSLAAEARAEEALRLVRTVRRAGPAWLNAALPELEWREIVLAAQTEDLSLVQLNLRTYLRGRPDRIARVVEQARAWRAEGKNSLALAAVREIVRLKPQEPTAQKLLRDWSAPKP